MPAHYLLFLKSSEHAAAQLLCSMAEDLLLALLLTSFLFLGLRKFLGQDLLDALLLLRKAKRNISCRSLLVLGHGALERGVVLKEGVR